MQYFDNASTTKVLEEAANEAIKCMTKIYGNPSSLHNFGSQAEDVLTNARKTIAKILGSKQEEIIFTSCATESTNLALFGLAKKQKHKKKIISTTIEHAATENSLKQLEKLGFEVVRIKPRDGRFYAEDFEDAIDDNTFLVSLMKVNNENGLILPVEEVAEKTKKRNEEILVHVDAVQAFCKLKINVKKQKIDLISISGHKVNAPKGVGALFVRKGVKLAPITFGGLQENGLKPGTENLPSIAAFNVAAKFNFERMEENFNRYKLLKKVLVEKLNQNPNIFFNFNSCCAPHIVNISVNNIKSETMVHFLESKNFVVSTKAACSKFKKSHILENLGYLKGREDFALRISFSFENTVEQVENLADAIILGEKTLLKI